MNSETLGTSEKNASFILPELFDLTRVDAVLRPLLESVTYPWEILGRLEPFLTTLLQNHTEIAGTVHPTAVLEGPIYLAKTASVAPHAYIQGPAWIGEKARVGHGTLLRGGVILASEAQVGHASEIKHSVLLNQAAAAHFNYVGDGILGTGSNLGAGVKLANLGALAHTVKVAGIDTGLRKFSAAVGDDVFIGCNAVLQPGSIIGARTVSYGTALLRGVYPADNVLKARNTITSVPRH